jgi:hypothetical protein
MNTYPEIAIILVTSHGTVTINKNTQQPYTFIMPNISMTLLNAVTPGVCNFWDTDDTNDFTEKLLKKLKDKEEVELLKDNPNAFINSLIQILKEYDIKMIKDLYTNTKNKDDDYDPDESQFIYHYDKSYSVRSYSEGDTVINKEYSRNNRNEQNESAWNFKILLVNKLGVPDVIREIRGRNNQDVSSYISFEEIINYLKNDGVKHVIFLDLSCSNFVETIPPKQSSLADIDDEGDESDKNNQPSEEIVANTRKIRSIRRNILKTAKGGRKKQKQRRTKRRKNTKRRKYKRLK